MTEVRPRPRLAFVSLWDASDFNAESSYSYAMREQLARDFEVTNIFPLTSRRAWLFAPLKAASVLHGGYYSPIREPLVLKEFARQIERRLRQTKVDVIFAPSTIPITYLDTTKPVVISTDQVFNSALDGYLQNPTRRFRRIGHAQESRALGAAAQAFFPSTWAACEARRYYPITHDRVHVVPWGANLAGSLSEDQVSASIATRSPDECRIVFIGRDWRRKGGTRVVDTLSALRRNGIDASLVVIGCTPSVPEELPVTIIPRLDKRDPTQRANFFEVMSRAHFLFVPSQAEAFGQVFCEACAFGVPSVGSTAGGIPTIIIDGVTGFTRSYDTPAAIFARIIADCLSDFTAYRRMACAAREDYNARLNWDRFGATICSQLKQLC
jgi:glycosyltransferase involved in cell wall biosynthesis